MRRGTVTGKTEVGGFVGNNGGTISGNNYWKTGSTGKGVGAGKTVVRSKTDRQFRELDARSTGWSTAIWKFEAGKYPKLKWQKPQAF